MIGFFVELGRFLVTLWGQVWRWSLRKRRNLFVTLGVILAGFIVFAAVTQTVEGDAPTARATATPTPTPTVTYTEVEGVPLTNPSAAPGSTAEGDAETAGEGVEAGTLAEPEEPIVDRDDPESVAKGWAVAYLSRPSSEWAEWRGWVADYTMPDVLEQMQTQAYQSDQTLDGAAPASVSNVTIEDAEPDAETSTAIRWSRNVVVEVVSEDKTTTTITYGLVLADSDDGWTVTYAEEIEVN